MEIGAIERQLVGIRFSIQDLDSQISQLNIPADQISSAGQLVYINNQRKNLSDRRYQLREKCVDLEGRRQVILNKREAANASQHVESKRLGIIGMGIDILGTAVGILFK